jgi:hypothetical protein
MADIHGSEGSGAEKPRQVIAGPPIAEGVPEGGVPVRPIDPMPGDGGTPIPPLPHGPRPIDPMPGDGGTPIPPLPHGPRPIDTSNFDDPLSWVVLWDPRITLTSDAQIRIERQLRKTVLAELAESDPSVDVSITAINEPNTRGIRIQRM